MTTDDYPRYHAFVLGLDLLESLGGFVVQVVVSSPGNFCDDPCFTASSGSTFVFYFVC